MQEGQKGRNMQKWKIKLVNKLFKSLLGDFVIKKDTLVKDSTISADILNCPFCGGKAVLRCKHAFVRREHDIYECLYYVECTKCGHQTRHTYPVWFRPDRTDFHGRIQIVDQRFDAIEEWNRRVEDAKNVL